VIEAVFHDAGTTPSVVSGGVPGMYRLRWRQLDMEESIRESNAETRLPVINAGVRDAGYVRLKPWPGIVPKHAPLDRYYVHEGFNVELKQRSNITQSWSPVPEGQLQYTGRDRALDRNQWRAAAMLTPAEMRQLEAAVPADWIRLPFDNEPRFGPQMSAAWYGLQASRFSLALPDNNLWTPFDLTAPDRYHWVGDDGSTVEGQRYFGDFGDRSRVTIYLRPRRWRWFARVIAHFWIVTGFEYAINDEVFLKVYYDRPPFFPVRHELPRTRGNALMFHQYSGMLDYDPGIERAFQLSRAFGELQSEIVQQQYFSLCVSYILSSVEPAAVSIQRASPRRGEVVCGIGIRDQASGAESRAWAVQMVDLSSVYPLQTISTFWANFWT